MRRPSFSWWSWAAVLLLAVGALAQDTEEQDLLLEVVVTASSGRSAYVDRGRDGGLLPGDRVRFFPVGEPAFVGDVRSVSSSSARVELANGQVLAVGTPGEVRVPAARLEAARPPEEAAEAPPSHPPWTRPPQEWDQDLPLLAPLDEIQPEDRATSITGRAFVQVDAIDDLEPQGTDTLYARIGTDLRIENPFRHGGRLQLDAELVRRSIDPSAGGEERTEERGRLERFSYAWGGTRHAPMRYEVGRFLQAGVPEFGMLDGVEVAQYFDSTTSVGVATGFLPEPTFELATGDDVQVAAYLARELGPRRDLAWRLGVQKTWHQGEPDRDLLSSAVHWRPSDEVSLRASALVDYYGSGERVKSSGLELTELHVYGDWRPSSRGGVAASYDEVRWPDLLRREFPTLPDTELDDQRFRRASLRMWRDLGRALRLSLRGDSWSRDEDDGVGGELRADLRDLPWSGARFRARLYANDGEFSSVEGLGLGIDHASSRGRWALGYELSRSEQEGFLGDQDLLSRQSLRASWDGRLGKSWSLSLHLERLFGDNREALAAGFYLQQRF